MMSSNAVGNGSPATVWVASTRSAPLVPMIVTPDGVGSLTGVTLMVIVLGLWSMSTPPLAVPPSSCTWKVKLA